jgi:hypothetical protein
MARIAAVTAEKLASLPEWAKHHIKILEMRLAEAKDELHRHLDNKPSEFAIHRPQACGDPEGGPLDAFLPEHTTVSAFLDDWADGARLDRKGLQIRRAGDKSEGYYLEVSTWGYYPSVQPQAANVLRIRLVEKP